MSQSAISTALMAELRIGPPRHRGTRNVLHDGLGDGGFLARDGAFAEPGETLVGPDLAEYPVEAAGVHDKSLQSRDHQVQGPGTGGCSLCKRADGGEDGMRARSQQGGQESRRFIVVKPSYREISGEVLITGGAAQCQR